VTVAFALSGGGNLGPLQAGAIRALVESGIEPDLFVGASVGALNAAFLATRPGPAGTRSLVTAWGSLRRTQAFRANLATMVTGFLGLGSHLVGTERFRALIRQWVQVSRIEDAPTPFAAVATDALTGDPVVLRAGDVIDALTASAAIPGIFPAVGSWLVDGNLSASCPVLQAQDLGADEVYFISTATAPRQSPPRGAVALAMNSVSLMTAQAARHQLAAAERRAAATGGVVHVVPSAEPPAPNPFDFTRGTALADAAYLRTRRWLEEGAPDSLHPLPPASSLGGPAAALGHAAPEVADAR
jgi:NTE family protein